jgi:outer membrane translocation and assembly module TamA
MHDPHLDAGGLRQSVGGSLIWRSPIGPVRVDLARPLGEDRGVQVLFSLGAPF